MRILLTNDDGVHAEGLLALKQALDDVAEVEIVAPDRPRSACGHSVTLHKPLRVATVTLADGSLAQACSGTPSDCVMLALRGLLHERPDLVMSGINNGPNLGWDLTYSGTVSAAMEACIIGVPSVALSCVSMDAKPYVIEDDEFPRPDRPPLNYDVAAAFAAHLAGVLSEHSLPPFSLLNVNVPSVPAAEINGVRLTRQGVRKYVGDAERRLDPMGRPYYWLGGDHPEDVMEDGTDVTAIYNREISVTPVHLDLTAYPVMESLHQWTHIEGFKA
ncbi:MAG TPA: 5'/3'-nucleotidase SurE [Armatimonadota bacterium]